MRYQVWLVRDGERASAALFRTDDSGWGYTLIESDEPMGTYETIGITPEPFDGSAGPTGPRLLGAHF